MVLVVKYCKHGKIRNPKSMDITIRCSPCEPYDQSTRPVPQQFFLLHDICFLFLLRSYSPQKNIFSFPKDPLPFFFSSAKNIFTLSKCCPYFPTPPKKIPSPSIFLLFFLGFFFSSTKIFFPFKIYVYFSFSVFILLRKNVYFSWEIFFLLRFFPL